MTRYLGSSAAIRPEADRAACAALVTAGSKAAERPVSAFGIESTSGHQWLPSYAGSRL